MKKQIRTNHNQPIFKGHSLTSDTTIVDTIKGFLNNQQFYEIELAEVRQVLTQQDVDQQTYPEHQPGAIKARLLFSEMQKQVQQLVIMIPKSPFQNYIPVVGQIVFCSKYPSQDVDVQQGLILDQYYYFDILNILNQQNNNAIGDVSFINSDQRPTDENQEKCGENFIIDPSVKKVAYQEGDIIISGRFGHSMKFSHNKSSDGKKLLPSIIISNEQNQLYDENSTQNSTLCGSYIEISQHDKDPNEMPELASNRSLLNTENDFSLIGNNFLGFSDRIILNAKTNDVQIYAKENIELSSQKNIFQQSKKITIQGAQQVHIIVGSNQITIKSTGVEIKASTITLDGVTQIKGIQDGVTPGFCSMPTCAFTGAPHTTKVVG